MSESLCRCTFYLRLKLLATKLHLLYQITKSVFGRLQQVRLAMEAEDDYSLQDTAPDLPF